MPEPTDDESLRFITGFADIFVTIGIALFLGALFFLMNAGTGSTPAYAGVAACAWLLAEFFTFKRRMALPSIVLLVLFVGAGLRAGGSDLRVAAARRRPRSSEASPSSASFPCNSCRWGWQPWSPPGWRRLHYIRFRVPITIAAGVGALCVLVIVTARRSRARHRRNGHQHRAVRLRSRGLALAMGFDMSDPQRLTRRTDIAFWLHLLAAPLIVHPLIRGFLHGLDDRLTTGAAVGILWVFIVLGFLAVIIDRRAVLVSSLVYAGFALSALIRVAGLTGSSSLVPLVLLALGAFILLLSAGWRPLRRAILRRLPARARRSPAASPGDFEPMNDFSPREIVSELDRFIVGQKDASVPWRSRCAIAGASAAGRRHARGGPAKNILMIGPTGCGKTEISRRLARLANAPFLKVEATKFTEVGYVGRGRRADRARPPRDGDHHGQGWPSARVSRRVPSSPPRSAC